MLFFALSMTVLVQLQAEVRVLVKVRINSQRNLLPIIFFYPLCRTTPFVL